MTDPTLTSTIARLRELEAKATPGPWGAAWDYKPLSRDDPDPRYIGHGCGKQLGPARESDGPYWRSFADQIIADGTLIAALRNAAPALLDAAERAEQADVDRIVAVVMRKDAEAERVLHAIRVPDERVLEAMRSAVATSGDCSGEQRGGGCRYGPKCTCREGALIAWQAGVDAIARPEAK